MAHAGTITITPGDASAVTHYKGETDNLATAYDETTETPIGERKNVDRIFANEINDNAASIADFETLFGTIQTTAANPIPTTATDPLIDAGSTALADARAAVDAIDNNQALKDEWTTYLDHVKAKAAAGEEVTETRPADPTAGDYTGGAVPATALATLGDLDTAVGDYSGAYDTFVTENAAYNTYTTASADGASGRATAEALENGEGLATGILASFNAVDAKIGDISTLPSDLQAADPAETTMVSAVTALNEKVGSLDDLNSSFTGTARDNVVAAVNSNADRITANTDAIASNSSRIVSLEEDVDELQAGVAMAIAIANAPIIQGGMNGLSLSGGFGHFKGKSAGSMKAAFMPMENVAITASVATDFDENVAAGAGIGFSF
ncbi:hypothetical protein GCM10007094_32630 [Pseudovibrio japonicus]|uniref:Trimeric autotransporter adhesin YadA-like C-terminal membrane anchor domain-containing protein n=2 Tax=Pseudovibrio japonicus TaxID=366534 RepID=A0ABQ3EK00_9HYPH|nr:hypothetical protein GCM10007094_32630 [Pseudovibrio japonicus]